MKTVKIKPFGVFDISDQVINTIEQHVNKESNPQFSAQALIKNVKKNKSGRFVGINPDTKKLFHFIPIINKNELFVSHFPDPIQLYFSLAWSSFQFSKQTRYNIIAQKGQPQPFNFVNEYLYNWHLQYKISTVIFLHSTIEAFVNSIMPEDLVYVQNQKGNKSDKFTSQSKKYNKEQTERYILYKEKLTEVVKQVSNIDFKENHKNIYDKLLNLNTMRNDIIHLRSVKTKNQEYFQEVFDNIINIELSPIIKAVKDFINIIKPNFIEFTEYKTNKAEEKIDFNFEGYAAFKLDISVFIKILDAPVNRIVLHIPKSDDKHFQFSLNWILQNLDIMAKEQLIYFPVIKTNSAKKIIIEIRKTEKSLGNNPVWDN